MGTTARNYSRESAASSGSFTIWVSRFPLIAATAIFTAISTKFLLDPVHSAAARGIVFSSNGGITVGRVGFGAFPLAFASSSWLVWSPGGGSCPAFTWF